MVLYILIFKFLDSNLEDKRFCIPMQKNFPTGIQTQCDYLGTIFPGDKMRLKIRDESAVLNNNNIHLGIVFFLQVRTDHRVSECGQVVRAAVTSVGES